MNDMSGKQQTFNEDEDPFLSNPRLRFMKRLVIALGVVLILGFITLVAAIIYRVTQLAEPKPGSVPAISTSAPSVSLEAALNALKQSGSKVTSQMLPAGSRHLSTAADGATAVLTFEDAGGFSILTLDLTTGRIANITRLQR